jgi:hypothetical protein
MTVELTDHEVAVLVRALEEHAIHRSDHGLSADEAAALIRKLKGVPGDGPAAPKPPPKV